MKKAEPEHDMSELGHRVQNPNHLASPDVSYCGKNMYECDLKMEKDNANPNNKFQRGIWTKSKRQSTSNNFIQEH